MKYWFFIEKLSLGLPISYCPLSVNSFQLTVPSTAINYCPLNTSSFGHAILSTAINYCPLDTSSYQYV